MKGWKDGLEIGAAGIYFIAETKAGKKEKDLTDVEVNKIRCGELHFKAVSELVNSIGLIAMMILGHNLVLKEGVF